MEKLEVLGAKKLIGEFEISGSKNASLPILVATLLSEKPVYLNNIPKVKDIETMLSLLKYLWSIIINKKKKYVIKKYNYNLNKVT